MLSTISAEALSRIAAARSILRIISMHDQDPQSIVWTRSAKGLLFVQNYSTYEFVVVEIVKHLVLEANSRAIQIKKARSEILGLALDPEISSIVDSSRKDTWKKRSLLFSEVRSSGRMKIRDGLFPHDGSHFRAAQLETIWAVFGIRPPLVPEPRLLGTIEEMVNNRNQIAHGGESAQNIGSRYTSSDLEKRINDTEAVCTHIIASANACTSAPSAFLE